MQRFVLRVDGRLTPAEGEALRGAGFALDGSTEYKIGVGGGDAPAVNLTTDGEDAGEVIERARQALGRDDTGGLRVDAAD